MLSFKNVLDWSPSHFSVPAAATGPENDGPPSIFLHTLEALQAASQSCAQQPVLVLLQLFTSDLQGSPCAPL